MRNNAVRLLILTFGLVPFSASAQTPDPKLKFESATIQVSDRPGKESVRGTVGVHGGPGTDQPEQLTIGRLSMTNLLLRAFGVRKVEIAGPPASLDNFGWYDIDAKLPAGATKDDVNVMLQNLLVDRLGLVFHRETKEVPGYELVQDKNGTKLTETVELTPEEIRALPRPTIPIKFEVDRNGVEQGRTGVAGQHFDNHIQGIGPPYMSSDVTMTQFTRSMEDMYKAPILDHTGLTGQYSFVIGLTFGDPPAGYTTRNPGPKSQPDEASTENFPGLGLRPIMVPLNLLVIDKLENILTRN